MKQKEQRNTGIPQEDSEGSEASRGGLDRCSVRCKKKKKKKKKQQENISAGEGI